MIGLDDGATLARRRGTHNARVDVTPKSRVASACAVPDMANVGFGTHMSDHMFVARHDETRGWHESGLLPYGPLAIDPRSPVLHYGQSVFEGMKVYRQASGGLALFRPDRNAQRFNHSASRMAMPCFPESEFIAAARALALADARWVPDAQGAALYLRPMMFADGPSLGVHRGCNHVFVIMACPVNPVFSLTDKPFRLLAREDVARTAPGGIGNAKTAANYGPTVASLEQARKDGFDNLLWLDAAEHRLIEEAGITNVFVRYADHVATPPLSDRILAGITRDTIMHMLRDSGHEVREREIDILELVSGIQSGRVLECFVTGTATVVAPVSEIGFRDRNYAIQSSSEYSMSLELHRNLLSLQTGSKDDPHEWMYGLDD